MRIPFINRTVTIKKEKRQHSLDDDSLYNRLYRGRQAKSGADVNDFTAMQSSAVWACIRVLSGALASLPLIVYKRQSKGRERAVDSPIYKLLHNEPNPLQTSAVFRSTAMTHLCLHGNAYAEIEYEGNTPVALWQIPPWKVRIDLLNSRRGLLYTVSLPDGQQVTVPQWRMLHILGLSTNGITGLGPIQHAREAIGLALASEEFGATYFGEGTNIAGVVQHPAELSDEAYKRLSQSLKEKYAGLGKAHRLMLLEEGMKFEKLTIPPDQSQFLETRQFQVLEIARIFGVPPHKISELSRATFSNIEEQELSFLRDTMAPWLVNFEQEINRKLFSDKPLYCEFLVEGMLRATTEARYRSYQIARNWGWLSANDIREMENLNPLPEDQGNIYLVPMNMQPAEWMTEKPEEQPTNWDSVREDRSEVRNLTKNRYLVARSYRRVFEEAGKRIVDREVANVRKAFKKHLGERNTALFIDWLQDFYRDFPEYIRRQMAGASHSLAEAIEPLVKQQLKRDSNADIPKFIQEYIEAYASRHAGSSLGQIQALLEEDEFEDAIETRLKEWEEKRPGKIGMAETVQLSNAVALTLFAGAGVLSLVWRNTSGQSCPFCSQLDGRKVGTGQDFVGETAFAEGETMKIRRPAMQPPLHRGCECQLEPE